MPFSLGIEHRAADPSPHMVLPIDTTVPGPKAHWHCSCASLRAHLTSSTPAAHCHGLSLWVAWLCQLPIPGGSADLWGPCILLTQGQRYLPKVGRELSDLPGGWAGNQCYCWVCFLILCGISFPVWEMGAHPGWDTRGILSADPLTTGAGTWLSCAPVP